MLRAFGLVVFAAAVLGPPAKARPAVELRRKNR